MEGGLTDDLLLESYRMKFERAAEQGQVGYDLAAKCRDYYDGKQLTAEEIAEMTRRKQPPTVINRVRRKVDWLRGLEMQSRTDPRAFPRTPQHEQGADAITDAIRYVCDDTDLDRKTSMAWDNLMIEGIGAVEVIHKDGPKPDVVINHYPFDRLFHDPHSRLADFSDARYLGAVVWEDADVLKEDYPGKKDEIDGSIGRVSVIGQSHQDVPHWRVWGDKDRQRIRVVIIWCKTKGKWHWAKFVYGGILEKGESPYVDEDGASVCALLFQSAYIDRDGVRYGVVKDMIDPQDEINKRRSKAIHQLNTRQTVGLKGVVESVAALKRELAKPDGHIEIDGELALAARELGMKPFELLTNADQTAGNLQMLQEAKNEIDLMGANSGLAGKEGTGQSGRAIMARQQGGLIEIAPLTDSLSDFKRRIYRHIWQRIRQFWREEKWIRVTDDERNIRFVGLNRSVTLHEKLSQMPEEQAMLIARQMQLVPNDPRLQMQVGRENPVEEIDVDIVLEEAPDMVTLETETFDQVVNIATSMPGSVPPDILIELAPGLRRDVKDRILKKLEEQSQQQSQQVQQQTGQQGQMLEIQANKTQSETAKNTALAQKTQVEAQRLALGY
jgi:hypothetical protein